MKCPKCGGTMSRGAPHCEGYIYQWECHSCGKIIGVCRGEEEGGNPYFDTGFGKKIFLGYD